MVLNQGKSRGINFSPLNQSPWFLTAEEKNHFAAEEFVKGLPVLRNNDISYLQDMFYLLASRLPSNININQVNCWHNFSGEFHNVCHHPAILDYVADILGPNFYHLAGQFFVEYPNDCLGSNRSDQIRAGITIRYFPTRVKCDLSIWPNFESYLARGEDSHQLNSVSRVPHGESHPEKKFQHSSEVIWD